MIKLWTFGLSLGAFLVASDIILDARSGGSVRHLSTELITLCILIIGLVYAIGEWIKLKKRYSDITLRLAQVNAEAATWKTNHEKLINGLSQAIDEQFLKWHLTHSEKEIALLLIKGLSLKEIADVRQCSEKTVRTHATTIYQKSGLNGRAELGAFFLEDLLNPQGV